MCRASPKSTPVVGQGSLNTVPTFRWERPVAWMSMMGADSVDYHRETVLHRSDDHPGQALAYYASRGETPLMWGGSGARALGLVGTVTDDQYAAIFGPGGAVDPPPASAWSPPAVPA